MTEPTPKQIEREKSSEGNMSDIEERLRKTAVSHLPFADVAHKRLEWEAADEIERLKEENNRLRQYAMKLSGGLGP